jgi:hypothetical protein
LSQAQVKRTPSVRGHPLAYMGMPFLGSSQSMEVITLHVLLLENNLQIPMSFLFASLTPDAPLRAGGVAQADVPSRWSSPVLFQCHLLGSWDSAFHCCLPFFLSPLPATVEPGFSQGG